MVGYVTNSMALVADSFHMLSDVAALVVAFLSVKVSKIRICMNITNIVNSLSMSFLLPLSALNPVGKYCVCGVINYFSD